MNEWEKCVDNASFINTYPLICLLITHVYFPIDQWGLLISTKCLFTRHYVD